MDEERRVDKARSIVILAASLVMTVAWAVSATGWTRGLSIVTLIGLGSLLIGIMVARSILPGVIAHIFSIIIGLGWSFWMTSRLLPAHYTWMQRWENLAFRLNYWYNQAIQGGTSYDNLMFILQMGVIVWAVGYLMTWFIFRSGRVWQAIVPGGVVLIINLYYAPNDITFWFLVYLLLSLLLVIRFNVLKQETKWRTEGVFFRPDISFDFLRDGFIFSALVIGIAWLTPPIVDARSLGLFNEFEGSWSELQGEWNRLYADLNYRNTATVGVFSQSLRLGGPRRLTDEPVMDVRVDGAGRYWRAAVYDEFTGDGWRNTDEESATFGPDYPLPLPTFAARQPVTQTYTFFRDGVLTLYAMSNPISLDRSAKVTFNAVPPEQVSAGTLPGWPNTEGPLAEEITYIRSNAAVDLGETYQVVSAASYATVSQLEEAGTDYPAWVTGRYLQLPDTVTERTRQLARELTESYDNPFDKAQAIERYIRTEIKYNEKIAAPPPGVDKVDYILFDLKEAYCDYYASSMIVLLRSVGIPARLAAGYARGTYDSQQLAFHVINADAHSWVEVYFPQYGWIEFEPTAAQPSIIRPTGGDSDSSFLPGNVPGRDDLLGGDGFPGGPGNIPVGDEGIMGGLPIILNIPWFQMQISLPRSVVRGGFIFMGIAALGGLVVGIYRWRQQQAQAGANIFNLYRGMVRLAGWMGVAVRPWHTPYEQASILQRRLPAFQHEVQTITDEYVYQTFGHFDGRHSGESARYRGGGFTLTYESGRAWRRLRPEMMKSIFRHYFSRGLRLGR